MKLGNGTPVAQMGVALTILVRISGDVRKANEAGTNP